MYRPLLTSLTLLAIAGCGSSPTSNPGADPAGVDAVPDAVALGGAADLTDIGGDTILTDSASNTARAAGDDATDPTFAWAGTGSRTVDLDALDARGQDRHPRATGTITIAWTGAVTASQPTGSGGISELTATLTVTSPVAITHRHANRTWTTTWSTGTTWTWSDDATWQRSSATVWTASGERALVMTDASATVTGPDGRSATIAATGQRRTTWERSRDGADRTNTYATDVDISGTTTRDSGITTWRWQRATGTGITLTRDGVVTGPLTPADALARWGAEIR
jgi:hypothetical protein